MKTIVHKLGGSTVGSPKLMKNILKYLKNNIDNRHIIVVSAINTCSNKNIGTTTLLEKMYNLYSRPHKRDIIENIFGYHTDLCRNLDIPINPMIKKKLEKTLEAKNLDNVIGIGEDIASIIVADYLKYNNFKSDNYILASTIDDNLNLEYRHNRDLLIDNLKFIKDIDNIDITPVYSGFLHNTTNLNMYKLLGRGYTDTTGAIISNIYGANKYNIWKESGGVFTANPNKISNAKILDSITLNEANELTTFGNDVLHNLTSKFIKDAKTTTSVFDSDIERGYNTHIIEDSNSNKDITAISSKDNLKIIEKKYIGGDINTNLNLVKHMNPILLSANNSGLTLLVKNIKDIYGEKIIIKENKSLISCIGENMINNMGIASKVMSTLSKSNINIEMISQGPSEINISVVVDSKDEKKALEALHYDFLA